MSAIIGLRDGVSAAVPYSPAKEKAATRGVYRSRSPPMRLRDLLSGARVKLLLAECMAFATLLIARRIGSIMGWNPSPSSSVSSPSRKMAWHSTDMVIGGQCGGWVLTVWWSPKQHFFIGSTWICTPIRCPHLFMIM
ncbi:hypothetical protein AAC387_Pa08g0910 [Persea americana]